MYTCYPLLLVGLVRHELPQATNNLGLDAIALKCRTADTKNGLHKRVECQNGGNWLGCKAQAAAQFGPDPLA